MSDFYANKENLPRILGHYLSIFSEGSSPIVATMRDGDGMIDAKKTLSLPCYRGFPEDEKKRWLEA